MATVTGQRSVAFTVPGVAAPGGSKKAFRHAKTGKIVVTDDAKNNKGWRAKVSLFGSQAMAGRDPLEGPLDVTWVFLVRRPRGHFGTGRNFDRLKPGAPRHPTTKPDVTKLVRAAEDALTGVVWADDAQIVRQRAEKRYGNPGLVVTVTPIGEEG